MNGSPPFAKHLKTGELLDVSQRSSEVVEFLVAADVLVGDEERMESQPLGFGARILARVREGLGVALQPIFRYGIMLTILMDSGFERD